jgi:hypothetical protein
MRSVKRFANLLAFCLHLYRFYFWSSLLLQFLGYGTALDGRQQATFFLSSMLLFALPDMFSQSVSFKTSGVALSKELRSVGFRIPIAALRTFSFLSISSFCNVESIV